MKNTTKFHILLKIKQINKRKILDFRRKTLDKTIALNLSLMIKIADIVQDLVRRSPFVLEALGEGLVNVSALARKLQPEVEQVLGKTVKPGAIVMAVNRMSRGELTYEDRRLRSFFQQLGDISVRANLSDYTFRNSDTLLERQAELLTLIGQFSNVFYTFSQGVSETTIIVGNAIEIQLESIFAREQLLTKEQDLASITLMLPTENRSLYGLYYYILKDLAWYGINLIELISTSNEFTIIVQQNDLEPAFSVLTSLRKGKIKE